MDIRKFSSCVETAGTLDVLGKGECVGSGGGISTSMTMKNVNLSDVASRWKRILFDAKSGRIREVRTQIAHVLENVDVVGIIGNWFRSLKWDIRIKRASSRWNSGTRNGVDFSKEWSLSSLSWTRIRTFRDSVIVIWSWRRASSLTLYDGGAAVGGKKSEEDWKEPHRKL